VQMHVVCWFEIKKMEGLKCKQSDNIRFNAFGLLPENLLYSMICSDEMLVRELAIKQVLSIRKSVTTKRLNSCY